MPKMMEIWVVREEGAPYAVVRKFVHERDARACADALGRSTPGRVFNVESWTMDVVFLRKEFRDEYERRMTAGVAT